jgi:two-component system chemotaxis response regulator CheB/chemosensory pili system protein ChpB (putative protein-glutamate methylesterase)
VSNSQATTQVALLYQTQELGRHLRDALASLGTPIVYEAATDHLDPGALQQSGARVVIVNLDPEVEAHLDEVYGLLEDDRYSVVFNDAQVSSGLSGWDQARWARHLAAKILGDVDIDPPRPEGAEAIPTPVPVAAEARADSASLAHQTEAEETLAEEIEMVSEPEAGYDTRLRSIVDSAVEEPVAATTDAGDPLDMLESRYDEMNQPAAAAYPSPTPPPDDEFDFSTLEALTATPLPPSDASSTFTDEFSEDESSVQAPSFAEETQRTPSVTNEPISRVDEAPADSLETDPDLEVFDLAALDKLFGDDPGEVPSAAPGEAHAEEASIDVGDLGDLGNLDSIPSTPADTAAPPAKNTAEKLVDLSHLSLLDDVDLDAPTTSAPNEASIPVSPLRLAAAADWSLEDMLEGDGPPAVPAPSGRAEFGIEKVSAAEYLAPPSENTAPPPPMPDLDSFSFELMPLEEAVAPQAVEREAHESWLDPDKVVVPPKIRRVWVLGASIGGPEAVREFLGELPRDYPALFLLAQHMGAEFVDLMAQQLAKATSLTVRTPTHGERVGHGEVIIVPTTHRLQVDPEGFVVLERASSDGAYSPSIDRVMRDVADRYGANAGAIIFSGMTTDAVDGAKYLAGKGGTVYAQHPDSCVVSSMVDGAIEAGVVKVLGTPIELADVLLAEHTKNKR